jgi:hypothetical protein
LMKRYSFLLKELAHAIAKLFVLGAKNRSGDHDNACVVGRI